MRQIPAPKRRPPSREPKRRFILFCEGRNTEPAYFRALERHCDSTLLEVVPVGAAGTPQTIAERATEARKALRRTSRDSFEKDDQFWAVFDRDAHPFYDKAIRLCEDNGIGVARSNPCFEVWLILHHQDFHSPDDRHQVQRHFAGLAPDYDPKGNKLPDCTALMKHIDAAEKRAETQLKIRENEGAPFGPPSTTVHHLTRAIRVAAETNKKKTP